ncbi:porin [Fulvivirgaceae bacterium PWU4]|uniref:Porin n=1 Tax=Chryseosolibacter histidini TaxID=2782349 RepID=A0AAP2DML1_9BACT|nr:porin [Chryseosolibacter histidini]MBT1697662.1 porin [Chryseosolibacter histidini]
MERKTLQLLAIITLSLSLTIAHAQVNSPVHFFAKKQKGVGLVTADSTFSLQFQFRIQNRAAYVSASENDLAAESFEFRVRRLRLKFEGFAYHPKLTYYFQLSVSRGDMDWRNLDNSAANSSPNIVRDAMIFYSPTKKLKLGFGQTKLPGNRQRVISSGDQQFADRSIVNAAFNIDRDFGFFAHYTENFFVLRGAITSGEGRNSLNSNKGLAYTGRIELLPLGKFTGNNDYQEGDLEREPKPKISIAYTHSVNDLAVRQAGTLGNDLYAARTLRTHEADILFKYNGWAWYNEYMQRDTHSPVTVNPADITKTRFVNVGKGYLSQLSYLFKNNFEVAGRYSAIVPFSALYKNPDFPTLAEKKLEQVELGVTKYLNGHRVKVQGNVIYGNRTDLATNTSAGGFWSAIFQVELGI